MHFVLIIVLKVNPANLQDFRVTDLPTRRSSLSEALGRCFFQMSMVKSVELLLKMEVSDDIRAAIITAIISPRKPVTQTVTNKGS